MKKSRINRAGGPIDFSLLTDGLRAEREQGITIDVAYRYFATPRRKFIIADTPGHEQYTRNMATGASTADLAIILIDARRVSCRRSRRHAFIASLLGIPHVVVAVNKMDLVDYSEEVFSEVCKMIFTCPGKAASLLPHVVTIPISALAGDNVVARSGDTSVVSRSHAPRASGNRAHPPARGMPSETRRFPACQYVIRPDTNFRGLPVGGRRSNLSR